MNRTKPSVLVKVIPDGRRDGQRVDVSDRIVGFEYEDSESKADTCKLTVDNYDLTAYDNPIWKKGNILEVTWGYPGRMSPTRKCLITKVSGFNKLTIEAVALSVLLNNAKQCRTWENKTYSQIASEIAVEWGYEVEDQHIERTDQVFEVVTQAQESDATFLKRLANAIGYQFWIDFLGFHFHTRDLQQVPHRRYVYFTDPGRGEILSINIENDITAKPGERRVHGRDPLNRANIAAGARVPPPGATDLPEGTVEVRTLPDGTVEALVGWEGLAPVPETVAEGLRQRGDDLARQAAEASAALEDARRRGDRAAEQQLNAQVTAMQEASQQVYMMSRAEVRMTPDGSMTTRYPGEYDPPASVSGDITWTPGSGPMPPELLREQYLSEAEEYLYSYIEQNAGETRAITLQPGTGRAANSDITTANGSTQAEAEAQARARHRATQLTAVQMKMEIVGDPLLLAKSVVEVGGIGRRMSGKYYVKTVKHKVLPPPFKNELEMVSDGTRGYGDPDTPEVAAPPPSAAAGDGASGPRPPMDTNPYNVPIVTEHQEGNLTVREIQDPDGTRWTQWVDAQGTHVDSNYEETHPQEFIDDTEEDFEDYNLGGDEGA